MEQRFRALHLERRWPSEIHAVEHGAIRGIHHGPVAVPQRDRSQAHPVLDVFVAVDVPHVAPLSASHKARRELRILIVALRVGMAAARDQRVGDFAEGARLWKRLVGSALRKRGAGALRSGGAVGHDVLLSARTGPQVTRRSTAQVVWQYEIRSAAGCKRARRRQVLHNRISLARSHP